MGSHTHSADAETVAPAIKALGSLFKLTQVHLWDDGWPETPEPEASNFFQDVGSTACDFSNLSQDVEFVAQMKMNELGLPISFKTNKERRNGKTRINKCNDDATFQDNTSLTSALTKAVTDSGAMKLVSMDSAMDKLDNQFDPSTTQPKKKARKSRAKWKSADENEELRFPGLTEEFHANIYKYWWQRYLLFSRFDDGIIMDEEGWFSVTPESIARHHAVRCGCGIIVDCFSGVGGNVIQFARRSKHVIAVDIDPKKIDYAYHNATIYGVVNQIDFIVGNFFTLAPTLKADTVFLSPPWGGPDYCKEIIYDIHTMLKPRDGYFLFNCAKLIASRVVMFLPRNVDLNQLAELALSALPWWSLEVEKNFLNGKLKAITAYFNSSALQ